VLANVLLSSSAATPLFTSGRRFDSLSSLRYRKHMTNLRFLSVMTSTMINRMPRLSTQEKIRFSSSDARQPNATECGASTEALSSRKFTSLLTVICFPLLSTQTKSNHGESQHLQCIACFHLFLLFAGSASPLVVRAVCAVCATFRPPVRPTGGGRMTRIFIYHK